MKKVKNALLFICLFCSILFKIQGKGLVWNVTSSQLPLSGATWNTPVAMNNMLYFQGQDGVMVCLNAQTGSVIWKDSTNFNPVMHHPVGKDGIIYTSNGSTFISIDGKSGSILWEVPIANVIDGTPIIDSMLFVAAPDSVYCLNTNNGSTIWKKKMQSTYLIISNDGEKLFSTSQTDVQLYALNPVTGDSLWTIPLSDTGTKMGGMALNGDILVISSDSNTSNPSSQKYYGINVETKVELWAINGYGYSSGSPPVIMGNQVYFSTRTDTGTQLQKVRAFKLTTGDSLWSYNARASSASRTPFISALDGKVFYENSVSGLFPIGYICADSTDGDTAWTTSNAGLTSYLTWGGLVVYDNKLYTAMDSAGIYCFDAGNIKGEWPMFGANLFNTNSYDSSLLRFTISGTIYDETVSDKIQHGKVYIYEYNSDSLPFDLIDSSLIDVNGGYIINGLYSSKYLIFIKADTISYPYTVPTYNSDVYSWNEANLLILMKDTTSDIIVLNYTPSTGSGSISGMVTYEDNSWAGADICLVDKSSNRVTAYEISNSEGKFTFSNLATGTYTIYVNVPGIPVDSNTYTVTTTKPDIKNILVIVDSQRISFGIQSFVKPGINHENANISVFPNPVESDVYIEISLKKRTYVTIQIFDLFGQERAAPLREYLNKGAHLMEFNLTNLPAGNYYWCVTISDKQHVNTIGKIVKIR